jgi:hypothetical protein
MFLIYCLGFKPAFIGWKDRETQGLNHRCGIGDTVFVLFLLFGEEFCVDMRWVLSLKPVHFRLRVTRDIRFSRRIASSHYRLALGQNWVGSCHCLCARKARTHSHSIARSLTRASFFIFFIFCFCFSGTWRALGESMVTALLFSSSPK